MLRRNVNLIQYLNKKKYPQSAVTVTYRFKSQKSDDRKDEIRRECPPDSSGRGFYYTLGGIIIGTGAVVLYAKYDQDFRNWIKENAPPFDEFIAIVTSEKKSILDLIKGSINSVIKDSLPSSETRISSSLEGIKTQTDGKKDDAVKDAKSKAGKESGKSAGADKKVDPNKDKAKSKKDEVTGIMATFDITGVQQAMVSILKKSAEVKLKMDASYKKVICFYRDMSDFYQQVVDGSVQQADPSVMQKIKQLRTSKNEALKESEDDYKKVLASYEELKAELASQDKILDQSTLISDDQKAAIKLFRDKILGVHKEMEDMKKNFEREKGRLSLTEKYWKQVQQARKHFSEELEVLFPNVRIQDKNMKLADEELDLFILYAFQNILFYQKELARLDSLFKANLEKALDSRAEDKDVVRAAIDNEMEQERRKIGAEFQKRMLLCKAECERDLKQCMIRQTEAHAAHVKELTELKEKQAEIQCRRAMDEKMAEMRLDHQTQLADIIGRMRALDTIIDRKLAADAKSNKSQELWSACQSLQDALQESDPNSGLYKQFKPLECHVEAVYNSAAAGDEYVDAVLSSLPVEARRRGVFTSLMLKDRFLNVKRVCKKVALLPEGGAPLPVMFLSWIQSKLIIDSSEIPIDELNNKEFDVSKLNTFQILNRANYWIERNDFKQALRYMNLLEGAPRAVAGDWIRETQIHLEVSQATKALMAYAAASCSAN